VAEQASMISVECIMRLVLGLRRSEGQTLLEYGLMIAVIAVVVIAGATVFGGDLFGLMNSNAAGV
jgi:Flp pilus assembly pilin Flp